MEYTYEIYVNDSANTRVDTTTSFEEIERMFKEKYKESKAIFLWNGFQNYHVKVFDNRCPDKPTAVFYSEEDLTEWRDFLERNAAWKPGRILKEMAETKKGLEVISELPQKGHVYEVEDDGFHETVQELEDNINKLEKGYEDDSRFDEKTESKSDADLSLEELLVKYSIPTAAADSADPINPPHYQNFLDNYQWLEAMMRLEKFKRQPTLFSAALELQVRKYLDRAGKKGHYREDVQKALWYLKVMIAWDMRQGRPFFIQDVDDILEGRLK